MKDKPCDLHLRESAAAGGVIDEPNKTRIFFIIAFRNQDSKRDQGLTDKVKQSLQTRLIIDLTVSGFLARTRMDLQKCVMAFDRTSLMRTQSSAHVARPLASEIPRKANQLL